jgi:hypothetical protein
MEKKTQRELVIRKLSFAEAEEADIEYYAGLNWKESAAIVEEMRKLIWNNEYKKEREEIIKKSSLKEDRDDFK